MLGRLARLPITEVHELAVFTKDEEVVMVEAALGAMVWTDRPAPALEILLQHLDSDRARVAIYALPRLAQVIAREQLVEALAEILGRPKLKITVHKEVLRLLGAYPTEDGVALLLASWRREGLHRDVQIAAVHAAKNLLHLEQAWALIAEAAHKKTVHAPLALLAWSILNVPERHRSRYLQLLLGLADHPNERVRQELFRALNPTGGGGWFAGNERLIAPVAARVFTAAESTNTLWVRAAPCLASCLPQCPLEISEALRTLVARALEEELTPDAQRDIPAHHRVYYLVRALVSLPLDIRKQNAQRYSEMARALSQQPRFGREVYSLQIAALDWRRPEAVVAELRRLLAPKLEQEQVLQLAEIFAEALSDYANPITEARAMEICTALAEDAAAVRRLAVSGVEAAGLRYDWPSALFPLLGKLRRDASSWVKHAALRVSVD